MICTWHYRETSIQWILFPSLSSIISGLSIKYSIMGLETGWRCHLPSWIEVGFYRSKLSGARILNNDGELVRYAILQNRKLEHNSSSYIYQFCHWIRIHINEKERKKSLQNKSSSISTRFSVMKCKSGMITWKVRDVRCTRKP